MAITNGYCTLAEFLSYIKQHPATPYVANVDDPTIEMIIGAASRFIDNEAGRKFTPSTETRRYDAPAGRELRLDADLVSVTTLTNGDGSVIASTDYLLAPANISPKREIRLKAGSAVAWYGDSNGNREQVISVVGSWGYFATVPDDIKLDCLEISRAAYNRRTGQTAEAAARLTAAGVVIEPADVPKQTLRNIRAYRKMT